MSGQNVPHVPPSNWTRRNVDCTAAEVLELLADAGTEPGDAFVRGTIAVIPRRSFPPDILDGDAPLLTDKDVPF